MYSSYIIWFLEIFIYIEYTPEKPNYVTIIKTYIIISNKK